MLIKKGVIRITSFEIAFAILVTSLTTLTALLINLELSSRCVSNSPKPGTKRPR